MAELIVRELLHRADALLVEELHIVARIAIEEIIGTHAQPEEMDLTVRVGGVVVNVGDIRRGKRTVAAEIREFIEMTQTIEESLVTTTRETTDGTMIGIVDSAVVLLYVRHQVIVQIVAEYVLSKSCLRSARSHGGWCGQQLVGITIGQYHDHLLGFAFGQEIVEDIVHAAHFIIHLLRIGSSTDQVEDGIALLWVLLILWRQIDHGLIGRTQTLGIVVDILQLAMRYIENVVSQLAFAGRNLQETVLETLVGEVLRILRIHYADAVDDEAVGIHVGGSRSEGGCPDTVSIALHGVASSKLYIHQDLLGLWVLVLEGYGSVLMTDG